MTIDKDRLRHLANQYAKESIGDPMIDSIIISVNRTQVLAAAYLELRDELAVARERLGPAGYKIITDFAEFKRRAEQAEAKLAKTVEVILLIASSHHYQAGDYGFQFENMARRCLAEISKMGEDGSE